MLQINRETPEVDEIPLEICDGEYIFLEMVGFGG
jgi:hypothetical protein